MRELRERKRLRQLIDRMEYGGMKGERKKRGFQAG